jgi:hypothetical protein
VVFLWYCVVYTVFFVVHDGTVPRLTRNGSGSNARNRDFWFWVVGFGAVRWAVMSEGTREESGPHPSGREDAWRGMAGDVDARWPVAVNPGE